jgi:hypothetical protein
MDADEGGGGISIDAMLKHAPGRPAAIKALVPLHDPQEQSSLYQKWISDSFTPSRLAPSLRFWAPLIQANHDKRVFGQREDTTVQPLDEVRKGP